VFIGELVFALGTAAQYLSEGLAPAAKQFAEYAGPPVNLVKGALDAMAALGAELKWPEQLQAKLTAISVFIGELVFALGTAAQYLSEGLAPAAKQFAEYAGPPVNLVKGALDTMKAISDGMTAPEDIDARLEELAAFVVAVVRVVSDAAQQFSDEGLTQAVTFADAARQIFDAIVGGVKAAVGIGGTDSEALARFRADMAAIVQIIRETVDQIIAIGRDLAPGAYAAGRGWAHNLAQGIRDGLTEVVAALQETADLFPHSPAKAGPLAQPPDWRAWMLYGMEDAAGMVGQRLATMMGPQGGGAGALQPATATVTVNGPFYVREEADIERLAQAIGDVFAGQTGVLRRMGLAT
jgi:hypothetical protein